MKPVILTAYLFCSLLLAVPALRAEDTSAQADDKKPNNVPVNQQIEEAVKQFQDRIKSITEQIAGKNFVKLNLDNQTVMNVPGTHVETTFEGTGDKRSLVVKIDGKETTRVPMPNLNIKSADLPPLVLPNVDAAGVRCESKSVNGVSNTKVWVDGKCVYDGPGSNSSSVSRNENGNKFIEVKVDGQVVYKVGEGAAGK